MTAIVNRLLTGRVSLLIVCCVAALVTLGGYRLAARPRHTAPPRAKSPRPQPRLLLPASERRHLWDIEHRVLVLDRRFWKGMSRAIEDGDRERLSGFFASRVEALGVRLSRPEPLVGGTTIAESMPPRAELVSQSRDDQVDSLLAAAKDLDAGRRISIKTVFLSPLRRAEPDGAWQGRCLFRVCGTVQGKPTERIVEADFHLARLEEEVPDPAPWITSFAIVRAVRQEASGFLFQEQARQYGFNLALLHDNWLQKNQLPEMVTGGVYLADYDNDGLTDVLIVDSQTTIFYRQDRRGRFVDVTEQTGLTLYPPGAVACFADFDNDGDSDLVANDQVFRNDGAAFHPAGQLRLARMDVLTGFAPADYDRDGRLDLYVTRGSSMRADPSKAAWLGDRTGAGNSLLRNRGGLQFEEVTEKAGAAAGTISCFAASWFDANGDLWPDLFAGDEFGSPVLLVNRGNGTFENRTVTGDFGGFCMGVAAGDLDDDGKIDLSLANMYSKAGERILSNLDMKQYPPAIARRIRHIVDGSELWHNRGSLRFVSQGRAAGIARVGWAYGPCLADFDNDGRLDVYAPAGFYSVSRDEPDG